MPGRILPLVTGQVYHIFNRGIERRPTFTTKREYQRAVESLKYYRIESPPLSLSKFLQLEKVKQDETMRKLEEQDALVEIYCFCLMPNHFHFLVRQGKEKGISRFLSNFQNSYTRYFNVRHDRDGSLFLDQFKAVRMETDEQLVHVSRYIHLNPYTSYVVRSLAELEAYPWSSLVQLGNEAPSFLQREWIQDFFHSFNKYKKFLMDQADYQRKLNEIYHLVLEKD